MTTIRPDCRHGGGQPTESLEVLKEDEMTAMEKVEQVQQRAEKLFSKEPDWATFYREILGVNGIVRQTFTSRKDLAAFQQSEAYEQIHEMLNKLRNGPAIPAEPTKVLTIRLPKSLHEAIWTEAHEHKTTMNHLCISKLLLRLLDGDGEATDA
jgi:predicted HicB family RNase H-like nuclease